MFKTLPATLAAIALIATPAGAQISNVPPPVEVAQPAATPTGATPWRFQATSYGWLMGLSGNVAARGQSIDTNATFLDLLQKSNTLVGLMGYFEAGNGPFSVYTDLVYTKLNFSASHLGYRNPLPALKISTSSFAAMTYELFVAEVGGTYQMMSWVHGPDSRTELDALVALRYWNNRIEASFDSTANVAFDRRFRFERSFGLAVADSGVVEWVDPVIGVRLKHQFTPRHEVMVRGDIGGFGVGSQFSWQGVAVYGYNWHLDGGQKITGLLGFRALAVNYTRGGGNEFSQINELLYGPIIGLSFRF
jgi:hypothetical protein